MRRVEIDDDVYNYLQSQAIPFEETPNLTLRRLLGLGRGLPPQTPKVALPARGKERKADLTELVRAGLLVEAEELACHDYTGNALPDATARVSGDGLLFRGRHHSMSSLARELLRANGFSSSSVRGPSHWRTQSGVSVRELWERHLRSAEAGTPSIGEAHSGRESPRPSVVHKSSEANMTWLDWIVKALENLGGKSSYYRLYNEILRIRPGPFPRSWQAIVRRTIETHSSDSDNFQTGYPDLFYSVAGIGRGEWGLRPPRA